MEGGGIVSHATFHAAVLPKGKGIAHYLRQRECGEVLAQHAVIIERLAVGHGGNAGNVGEEPREVGNLLAVDPHLVGRIGEDSRACRIA